LEQGSTLISILIGATGIISLLLSNPSILFEKIEDDKELSDLEMDFTLDIVRNLKRNISESSCTEGMRDGYNLIIKTVGFLENTAEEYSQTMLSFKRVSFMFGCFLLLSAFAWFTISECFPYAWLVFIIVTCIIGTMLITLIVSKSLKLRRMMKSYREYKNILRQQKANIAFRKMLEETM